MHHTNVKCYNMKKKMCLGYMGTFCTMVSNFFQNLKLKAYLIFFLRLEQSYALDTVLNNR